MSPTTSSASWRPWSRVDSARRGQPLCLVFAPDRHLRQPTTRLMSTSQLQAVIDAAWERRAEIGVTTRGEVRANVETALAGLDDGSRRGAQSTGENRWQDTTRITI